MDAYSLFIDSNLPPTLKRDKIYELLNRAQSGDETAREKIINHNIKLVLFEVSGKFSTVNYEKKDLVSIGIIGLIKAVDTFDITKGIEFATYAIRCIDNEILMFLRKIKKERNVSSMEEPIMIRNDGAEIPLESAISDDTNLEEEYVEQEVYQIVREIVESLPDKEREIVMMSFGFLDDKIFYQEEIAKKLNISQTYVSKILHRVLKEIELTLKKAGISRKKETKGTIRKKTPRNNQKLNLDN